MNIWNTICKDILDKKTKQATEKEYQELVYTHFRYLLGWHCERVENQYQLRVGSTVNYVYPDIVFFKNDNPLFVIEMKKPNHTQNKEEIVQLFSYMKLLPVQFGIYMGEHIELFYYEFGKEPISILKIDFVENSNNGKNFIELFKQENFNAEQLTNFCIEQIAKQEKQKEINEFINELTTEKGKQLFIELLNLKLTSEGYSTEDIQKITNEIEINIHHKNQMQTSETKQAVAITRKVFVIGNDNTRYRLNGNGIYTKSSLAYSIVNLWINNNQHLTYEEIEKISPLKIRKYSLIQEWKMRTTDPQKDRRWFDKEDELKTSSDGIIYAFDKGIDRHKITNIIEFGRKLGYTIEAIK